MESQSADSGNRFAGIEPLAGISLLLRIKQIRSCVPKVGPMAPANHKTGSQHKMPDIIRHGRERAVRYQFFGGGTHGYG